MTDGAVPAQDNGGFAAEPDMNDEELEIQEDGGDADGFDDPTERGAQEASGHSQAAMDASGGSGGGGEDSLVMGIDVEPSPAIFTSAGYRRIFIVEQIIKASGVHRPTFQFFGYIVELPMAREWAVAGDHSPPTSPQAGTGARVLECDLMLTLRYEPPSPKFRSKCPGFTSYRLKVSRGMEFLYSMRGLQKQMWVDSTSRVAVWGKLELAFGSPAEIGHFLNILRHVDVTEQTLLDARELDSLIQLTTDLAELRGQFGAEEEEEEEEEYGEEEEEHGGGQAGYEEWAVDEAVATAPAKAAPTGLLLPYLAGLEDAAPGSSYLGVALAAGLVGFAGGWLAAASRSR
eukprot:jgi/Tetstr1/433294/TSEL_022581.t1